MGVSMATAEEEKTLPIYIMKVPGNHLNNAQETNLNWNRVVIQLQECKRPSERSFNRAVDNGSVGDLGPLCIVNLLEEEPVEANRINYYIL